MSELHAMRQLEITYLWLFHDPDEHRYTSGQAAQGHFTSGGSEDRIESTLPPVFSPKIVPRS
jgi:hypothetical protein